MKRDNSGSIGKNKRKEKDSHPDLKGQAVIGGTEYWISGWRKEGDDGAWYSLAFEPKQAEKQKQERRPAKHDEDIPF